MLKMRQNEGQHDKQKDIDWATIRLPEILQGLSDKEYRQLQRKKQQQYKQTLDQIAEDKPQNQFEGMSDVEILLNKRKFKELGLL
jgi:hypothetical protein